MAGEVLRCPAGVEDVPLSPDFAYDPIRKQTHSTMLLEALAARVRDTGDRVLGVTEADLFIPILTFVFGEAQLGGPAAVISIARLKPAYDGSEEDQGLLYHRSEKEVLHELGHTLGLIHCPRYECVMHFSNSVEEVDLKGDRFCDPCSAQAGLPPRLGR